MLRDARPELRSPLLAGGIAPECVLPNLQGATIDLRGDSVAGNTIVLVFYPKFNTAARNTFAAIHANLASFESAGARLFAVTLAPRKVAAEHNIPFMTLIDSAGRVFRDFGANRHDMPTIIILRSNHHVTAILDGSPETQMANALAVIERLAVERRSVAMSIHPPVLMIPEVLGRGDCERLIEVVETRGLSFVEPGPGIDYLGTDYKMRIPEHMREDRIDYWIFDKDTMAFLGNRLLVWPEIRKPFQYHVTKQEALRIGCYHGSRGGHLHGHRDDVPPTTYRRFAMSINLNENFDGGELRFPEFGDQRYRPETGTAIVFSSSLLHEALHVTAGRRLVVLAFLFGEQ